jgi:hypothetical protein
LALPQTTIDETWPPKSARLLADTFQPVMSFVGASTRTSASSV